MGLANTYQRDGANYLSIYQGKFAQRVTKDTEGAELRTLKTGKEVYEIYWGDLSGIIKRIEISEHSEYGKQWKITIQDVEERYVFQMPYTSGYAKAFLYRIESVNLAEELMLCPYYIEYDEGKYRALMGIFQDGKKISSNYLKENDYNGMPPSEEKIVDNKKVWDNTKKMEFLEEKLNKHVIPDLENDALYITDQKQEAKPASQPEATESKEEEGEENLGLPF